MSGDRRKVHFERLGYAVLLMRHRYLCVNSALHYLRPPLRGLKLFKSKMPRHGIIFRIISPLRGLKPIILKGEGIISYFRITTPLRGQLNALSLLCKNGYE